MGKTYIDTDYCPYCDKETLIEYYDSEHERDSSHDKETCMTCGAYRYGFTGEWTKNNTGDMT